MNIKTSLNKIVSKIKKQQKYVLTDDIKKCLDLLENTDQNLFITGKAGTGKSLLIQYFRSHTSKKVAILAPTGIAALNARGQTIHSFFGFPPCLIESKAIRKSNNNRLFADLDCLIIDEISMVRADLIDGIDKFLRLNGRDSNVSFGGIRIVFVGDLYQLPPVLRTEESVRYYDLYSSPYFFSANSFQPEDFIIVELTNIFRQSEREFIDFLNHVRTGEIEASRFDIVNQKVVDNINYDKHTVLCTINKTANDINQTKLNEINKPQFTYKARIEGDFPIDDQNLPVELDLMLKEKAKVLFVKNDPGGRWVNGTLGVVTELGENLIKVKIDNDVIVEIEKAEWNKIKYVINSDTGDLEEKIIGKLIQYPLRLAWAITIHKSQGMTLNKVCLDFRRSPFAHGQTYVALSRCRSLDGLVMTRRIWPNDILIDDRIVDFHRRFIKN